MNLASSYARALHEVAHQEGAKNTDILKNFREALARRGHEKLLPKIFAEYEKLETGEHRLARHKKITPEAQQTRVLLELYRKLTSPTA